MFFVYAVKKYYLVVFFCEFLKLRRRILMFKRWEFWRRANDARTVDSRNRALSWCSTTMSWSFEKCRATPVRFANRRDRDFKRKITALSSRVWFSAFLEFESIVSRSRCSFSCKNCYRAVSFYFSRGSRSRAFSFLFENFSFLQWLLSIYEFWTAKMLRGFLHGRVRSNCVGSDWKSSKMLEIWLGI